MKLVTYNIQFSRGKDGRYDLGRIVDTVRDADIIALQEVERNWPRSGMADQPAEIARMLPDYHWAYGPEVDVDASEVGEDGRVTNRRRQFGNMLLSRWPLISVRNHVLPYMGTTSHWNGQSAMLEGVVEINDRALRIYSMHLSHQSERERLKQIDFLLDLHRRVWLEGGVLSGPEREGSEWQVGPPPPMPFDAVYLGDFNFDPPDPEYERLVGPLDPDYGRVSYRDLLVDAWVAAGNAETSGVTFPPNPEYPTTETGWRLDYCFVTPTLQKAVKKAWIDEDAQGSDHQPMWVELEL